MSIAGSDTSAGLQRVTAERWPLAAAVALIAAIFVYVFWDFLSTQVRWAIERQADWGHTLVIPFIAGYFVWLNRHKLLAHPPRVFWPGLAVMVGGMAWYSAATLIPAMRNHNFQGLGVWMTLVGLVVLLTGVRSMRYLWFPLLYLLIFGQSVSDRGMTLITFYLQDIAARGSHIMLILLGLEVDRAGNVLTVFDSQGLPHTVNIVEACSGMRMLMAFLALGTAMAYTGLRRFWQRAALIALAVPVALFVNMLRVATLGVLSLVDSGLAAGDFHSFVGLVWLVPALFIYLGLTWIIRNIVIEPPRPPERIPEPVDWPARLLSGRGRLALGLAIVVLAVGGVGLRAAVGHLNVVLRKEPVELRQHLAQIPIELGAWHAGQEVVLDEAGTEALGTDQYLTRAYVHQDDGTELMLHIAYYTGMIDAVPHVPARCLVAGGWTEASLPQSLDLPIAFPQSGDAGDGLSSTRVANPLTGRLEQVHLPEGAYRMSVSTFTREDVPGRALYAGYFFIANNALTPSARDVRMLAFSPSERHAYYAKVELSLVTDEGAAPQHFVELSSDLLQHLLPHLMRCLPDWPAVGAAEAAGDEQVSLSS